MRRAWVALALAGCVEPNGGDAVDACVLALSGDVDRGAVVWRASCAGCHGASGEGAQGGPDVRDEAPDPARLVRKVLWGWGEMPGFHGALSKEDVADVVAFVQGEILVPPPAVGDTGGAAGRAP
jgi:mono/diheme cytochrome c family protein